jgi:hypothetical protein
MRVETERRGERTHPSRQPDSEGRLLVDRERLLRRGHERQETGDLVIPLAVLFHVGADDGATLATDEHLGVQLEARLQLTDIQQGLGPLAELVIRVLSEASRNRTPQRAADQRRVLVLDLGRKLQQLELEAELLPSLAAVLAGNIAEFDVVHDDVDDRVIRQRQELEVGLRLFHGELHRMSVLFSRVGVTASLP